MSASGLHTPWLLAASMSASGLHTLRLLAASMSASGLHTPRLLAEGVRYAYTLGYSYGALRALEVAPSGR